MDVLYVGPDSGTSRHRAQALGRLGHRVHVIDPFAFIRGLPGLGQWTWRTGGLLLEGFVRRRIRASLPGGKWELTWVDGGELIGPALIQELRMRSNAVVNYNVDDPFGRRDGRRWRLYLRSVPCYDLVVVVREVNVAEAYARGARGVLRLYRSADEEAHAPRPLTAVDRAKWTDGVIFVGTWMPERGPLLASLLEAGVPLSIHGDGWRKAAEWPVLQPSWRGPALYGEDYVKAIRHARVCLGLLSKGNRDLHTQRSMEIPFAGGLLCAERTSEHRALYAEDEEAVFWEGPQECAARCLELLADDTRGRRIAEQGRRRAIANAHLNEQVADRILCEALR